MSAEEYFGDWITVIDIKELAKIIKWLNSIDKTKLCPQPKDIFKAFKLCSLYNCRAVFIGQDPYPQKGVATGILFGNNSDNLSPSLEVVKEAVIDYSIPHNNIDFDNSLESWAKQGILMLNSSLTCEVNNVGSHINIWNPFMTKFIYKLSKYNPSLVYALFGKQAELLEKYIVSSNGVFKEYHPAYYARLNTKMPNKIFKDINKFLIDFYGFGINYYGDLQQKLYF